MLRFRLKTLNTGEVTPDVLAAWELATFFLGEASPSVLPIDPDSAREWYIETIVDATSREDYRAEPQMADDELAEDFANSLKRLTDSRVKKLAEHYPFSLDPNGHLVRKNSEHLSAVGASYIALQFFRAVNGGTVEIDDVSEAEITRKQDAFNDIFRKIFEYIAGYAVAGKREGAPFMTSECRSAQRLEVLLKILCRKVGAGTVLPFDNWNGPQRATNDGGVDCLAHIGGPEMPGDAHIILVGATVQRNRIDGKIMGPEKLDFMGSFFSERPAAFQGALVRPQDEDALTKEKCIQKNCLLFSYDQIWHGMGKRNKGRYQSGMLKRLDVKARKLLRQFLDVKFLHEYDEYDIEAIGT